MSTFALVHCGLVKVYFYTVVKLLLLNPLMFGHKGAEKHQNNTYTYHISTVYKVLMTCQKFPNFTSSRHTW